MDNKYEMSKSITYINYIYTIRKTNIKIQGEETKCRCKPLQWNDLRFIVCSNTDPNSQAYIQANKNSPVKEQKIKEFHAPKKPPFSIRFKKLQILIVK